MVEGYFKIMVLKELDKVEHTGYELMKKLEAYTGKKPSAGSIYPLLNELLADKLVSVHKDGRKKHYTLTTLGKRFVRSIIKEKKELVMKHIQLFRKIECGAAKASSSMDILADMIQKKEHVFMRNLKPLTDLRDVLLDVMLSEDFHKKEEKFMAIIRRTVKDMRKEVSGPSKERSR
jgi:DNA-binding PadR family transcriptional regulator